MTWVLIRKLLRDVRLPLVVVAVLLFLFQLFWARVTDRVLGELAPFFHGLAELTGQFNVGDIQSVVFNGPGKIAQSVIGGDSIDTNKAMDMLSIGYVHPLVQLILCLWAVGRSSGAIAGEIDKGTMELLLSQPLARLKIIAAHLCVDLITIPILCLSVWAGTYCGYLLIDPIKVRYPEGEQFKILKEMSQKEGRQEKMRADLEIRPLEFWAGMPVMAGLVFAVSGFSMMLSACGRFRWRVLGLAVLLTLTMFLVNLLGQMLDWMAPFRPLTIFYYYQPQKAILKGKWMVDFSVWNGDQPTVGVPMLLVLFGIGIVGYLTALVIFTRRDIPAPL